MTYETALIMETLSQIQDELKAIKDKQPTRWLTRQDLKGSETYPNGWPGLRTDKAITEAIDQGLRYYGGQRNQLFLESELLQYVSNQALSRRYKKGVLANQ